MEMISFLIGCSTFGAKHCRSCLVCAEEAFARSHWKMAPRPSFRIKLLAMLFGTGSWIAITGLWLEIPLLITALPEQWTLASHLNIAIQIANIGPLIYWIGKRFHLLNDVNTTHLQLWLGMISCLVLIFYWEQTFFLFGQLRSLVLLVCTFGLALVDCTSSVTFLPFMARFETVYMTPYLVGEGQLISNSIPKLTFHLCRSQWLHSDPVCAGPRGQGGKISQPSHDRSSSPRPSSKFHTQQLNSRCGRLYTGSDTKATLSGQCVLCHTDHAHCGQLCSIPLTSALTIL